MAVCDMFTIGKENLLSALDGFVKVQAWVLCVGVVGINAWIPNVHRGSACYNLYLLSPLEEPA